MVAAGQSEPGRSRPKYALCSPFSPQTLFSIPNPNSKFGVDFSASSVVRVERAPAFGWGNATCRDGFSCAQSLSSGHVTPLPHTEPDMEEAADMFDSNVLPKKYQDGREDFLSFFLFFPPSSPLTKLSLLDLPMTPHSLSDKSLIHVCANTSGV